MYSPPTKSAGHRATGFLRRCAANMLGAVVVTVLAMPANAAAQRAIILNIDGVIGPAVADYVLRELRTVARDETGLIVLRMNTPGGIDTSMREIVSGILASPVPVATYVAPNGARAASAGTYIAYASAIVGMAPGTNIGAATPVQFGSSPFFPGGRPGQPSGQKNGQEKSTLGEPADTESRKAINDAVAYIRSLADLNSRNADWAAEAVRAAASLQASEALKLHVIDVIADDVPDLLRKIDGRGIKVSNVEIKRIDLDESMIRAIARQAEAERTRRAKIINAEGEQQAAQKLLDAAKILAPVPQAMQLRYLATLFDIASERSSTIVFPFPIDLTGAMQR
jgi:membrane-bound serine protease (ClpP class)